MTIAEKYQAERERIENNRRIDWSSFGFEYIAAGEKMRPMTLQVWFDLMALKSPILSADEITEASVVDYIWRNSVRNKGFQLIRDFRLFRLERRVANALKDDDEADALLTVIYDHAKEAFEEMPVSSGGHGYTRTNALAGVSGETSMVDEIAHRYGQNPQEVLQWPLRKVFNLMKAMRFSTVPNCKFLEPESLRAIKSEYLNSLNNGAK